MRLSARLAVAWVAYPLAVLAQPRPAPGSTSLASGRYVVGLVAFGDTVYTSWTLRVVGDSVHGDIQDSKNALHGVVRRDSLELVQRWDSVTIRVIFRGLVRDGKLSGEALEPRQGHAELSDTARWFASPEVVRTRPARAVAHEPTTFPRVFSAAIAPALRIFPGDTVNTRTIDARGVDWNGVQRSLGGNPQSGPYYVEGAMPGDVIAIHLHRVRLNRDFCERRHESGW